MTTNYVDKLKKVLGLGTLKDMKRSSSKNLEYTIKGNNNGARMALMDAMYDGMKKLGEKRPGFIEPTKNGEIHIDRRGLKQISVVL